MTQAHDSMDAVMNELKTGSQPKKQVPQVPKLDPKDLKVELEYKYTGLGEDGRPVETIVLDDLTDDKKTCIVVAWSPSLKKKIQSRTVAKL